MFKKDVNMLEGPIMPSLLAIAVPIMVMNILQSVFRIIDMTMLKTFGAADAVGAVGVCGTLIALVTCLLSGLATGANVVIARNIGKRDKEGVQRAVGTAFTVAFLGGVFLMVIGLVFAEVFLGWINCPVELLADAALYFRLYFIGVPVLMVYNFAASIFRSTGDSKSPMIYSLVGSAAKVLLNAFFVGVCNMAIAGVGLATIISWAIYCIPALVSLFKNDSIVKVNPKKLRIYRKEALGILHIGIPVGVQTALYSVANVMITATVNTYGPAATTGVSIAGTFDDGLLYPLATASAAAVMSYVSQNVGAGNLKRAGRAVRSGALISIILAGGLGVITAVFSGPLSSIMSSDPEVIAYSQQRLILIAATYFICGIYENVGAALRGIGKPIIPTVTTLVFMCAIRFVWVAVFYPLCPNLTFLYLIWPIGWVLSTLTSIAFYIPAMRKLRRCQLQK